ncbi:MAG: dTDP-glucose 4,6-dehydratase [Tagaea sp.]
MKGPILVTGGCGFIGSAYIRRALRDGAAIVNVDKLGYAANPEALEGAAQNSGYVFHKADIGDRASMRDILARHKPVAIANFAAETHVDRSIDGPLAFVETNVGATARLLVETLDYWKGLDAAARAAFRFHHVSTDEVFGALGPGDEPFRETTAYAPNSPYAASKAASDHLVRAWHVTYGLPTLITNCSNNYGPWQFPEKLIPLMIAKAAAGEALPVYGDGRQVRDWLHVEDHAHGLALALARGVPGRVYAFGGDAEVANIDVVRAICARVDVKLGARKEGPRAGLISHVADRPGHDRRYAIDARRAKSELGWAPARSFEEGLAATVDWYLAAGDWLARIKAERYALGRLGAG